MHDGVAKPPFQKSEATARPRRPWARPALTKLQAADAENFTRPTAHDGQLTFS